MAENQSAPDSGVAQAPYPGSKMMPRWNVDTLLEAPRFGWKNWAMMLGPGLVMGGSAIGGGEWLMGPIVTAKYGGGLFWLATLSILGQVIYNIEISRYTLYSGEPIFTGKFRTLPGPMFWVGVYLLLDFGAVFPYLAAHAATPLAAVLLGQVPDPEHGEWAMSWFGSDVVISHKDLLRNLGYGIFLAALVPLVFGGKIYNALKGIMSFKIITVMGFLLVLSLLYSDASTWKEIFSGFVKFGNVPVRRIEDANNNGILDPGEDWDGDGRLDLMEPSLKRTIDTDGDGKPDATDIDADRKPDPMVKRLVNGATVDWPDMDRDGQPDETVMADTDGDGKLDGPYPLDADKDGNLDTFIDIDGDGTRDGDNLENVILTSLKGKPFPRVDFTMIAFLSALVAISGSGGLSNTPISNYTRDQGWGMGHYVGAIPSVVGGRNIQLSHVGTVFLTTSAESLSHWRRWYRHVLRDQLVVWMPACFFGLALPSVLSVEFLKRGTVVENKWVAASMTAGAVQDRVGGEWGYYVWFLTLFCGFLVLAPSMATSADGFIRRWVDVFWTAVPPLRRMKPTAIRWVYFGVLSVYATFGLYMLSRNEPEDVLKIATTIYNFALAFSCWHTLVLNMILLPKEIRPGWFVRIAMFVAGLFFWIVATFSALDIYGYL